MKRMGDDMFNHISGFTSYTFIFKESVKHITSALNYVQYSVKELYKACEEGEVEIVKYYFDKIENRVQLFTAIYIALVNNHPEIFEFLIAHSDFEPNAFITHIFNIYRNIDTILFEIFLKKFPIETLYASVAEDLAEEAYDRDVDGDDTLLNILYNSKLGEEIASFLLSRYGFLRRIENLEYIRHKFPRLAERVDFYLNSIKFGF